MTYQVIPLPAAANSAFSAVLDGQDTAIALQTTDYGLFVSVSYAGAAVITGRLALDRTDLNPNRYTGLPQALFFADLQGTTDPVATGFNSRYLLVYGEPASNGGRVIG